VQGGLIAGVEVGPVLVDITPHTLGIEALGELHGLPSIHTFAPIIERNTPLPASRTEIFSTVVDGQKGAEIKVFQGEDEDTQYNTLVGEFKIEGLADVGRGNQILVRLDLDLNGILKVTATERATGLARHVTIDSAIERFRTKQRTDAIDRLEAVFGTAAEAEEAPASPAPAPEVLPPEVQQAVSAAKSLIARAERLQADANPEDAAELKAMLADLQSAVERRSVEDIRKISDEIEDLVFYLEDN
jgi:molecular chaperone DnaK